MTPMTNAAASLMGSVATTGGGDVVDGTEFVRGLRHAARFRSPPPLADAIGAVLQRIRVNPGCMQGRLLARVLTALVAGTGEFRLAEISVFDAGMLDLVLALLSAAEKNAPTGQPWLAAVIEADAAVAGAGA
jgi:hypothetical protein